MDTEPWYRQFWPWFLFGLPGVVVVAGLSTWLIAERGADHLVADDYYKEGLAINRQLDKRAYAQQLGMRAHISLTANALQVDLQGEQLPPALSLNLSHPLDANQDRIITLPSTRPGSYETPLLLPRPSRWHWKLEPIASADKPWQLEGELAATATDGSP